MSRLSLRNPLLTPEQISQSPSQQQGITRDLELNLRAYGCHLIQATGTILQVPQMVMASAQILFQRFYYLASFQDFPLRGTVLGALFLACKVEENPQTIRNIINVYDIVVKRDRGFPEIVTDGYDGEYYDLKNEMVISELQILRKLGFNVQVELPYGLLANYLQSLELTEHPTLPQLAWNYLNDLLRTPVYVCFQPETITCGVIYLAAYKSGMRLPESPPWWIIFDANGDDVVQVAKATESLYLRQWPKIMPLDNSELSMHLEGTLENHIASERKKRRKDANENADTNIAVLDSRHVQKNVDKKRAAQGSPSPLRPVSRSKTRSRSRSRTRQERPKTESAGARPMSSRDRSRERGRNEYHQNGNKGRSNSRTSDPAPHRDRTHGPRSRVSYRRR